MREKLKALMALQTVDLEIAALKRSAETYPKQLSELEREQASARSAVEQERGRLQDIERQKRSLEQSISEEKEKVRKWESRLSEQRSTREYAALAREIDIAKKANQTMVEQIADLAKEDSLAREAVKAKEQEFFAQHEAASGKVAQLKKRMRESAEQQKLLEEKRAKVAAAADKQLLHRYEAVKRKKMPPLVAVQPPGTCQGCNMNVPPQLYNTLRSTLGIDMCPSCHRMIYAVEAVEAAGEKS